MQFDAYQTEGFYDEMFEADGQPRPRGELLARRLESLSDGELQRRQKAADLALLNMGITFNVYGHEAGTEKIWPFDILPRIIELARMDNDRARAEAADPRSEPVHRRHVPRSQNRPRRRRSPIGWSIPANAFSSPAPASNRPRGIWCHITGTDLVRDSDGRDVRAGRQPRCPSGVSYVLENREVMKRTFPQMFDGHVDPAGRGLSRAAAGDAAVHRPGGRITTRPWWC